MIRYLTLRYSDWASDWANGCATALSSFGSCPLRGHAASRINRFRGKGLA